MFLSPRLLTRIHYKALRNVRGKVSPATRWVHVTANRCCQSQGPKDSTSDVPDLSTFPLQCIRNFSIIAHVDHGKSTLADRILEITGAIKADTKNKQVLDKLQVERERGITVKAQTASVTYKYRGKEYLLNLIDTPGHVDFTYEVSRSLSACQGVILLVDANGGVQAQTVANFYLAFTNELAIIPVLNKIDLKNADPEAVKEQLFTLFEINPDDVLQISAKLGMGVTNVLEAVIEGVPSPAEKCTVDSPLRLFLFDSWFDKYKGVVCLVLVVDGCLKKGDQIMSSHTGKLYEVKDVGILAPNEVPTNHLYTGQVGYFTANIRNTKEALVGDTFYLKGEECEPLPGFRETKPLVFAGVYPMDQSEHGQLKAAIERLCLNDRSVSVSIETSSALGQGWRLGFLGLLHMDVFNQRLEQEHGAQVIMTTPSVPYKIQVQGAKAIQHYRGEEVIINNPVLWPDPQNIVETSETFVRGTIITPVTYLGDIIGLCQSRRGVQQSIRNIDNNRIIMHYKLPLNEIVVDFYDILKSLSSGYATFDYEELGFELSYLVKLDILLNGYAVPELSTIVHSSKARTEGKRVVEKLKDTLPRQMFKIAVQAAVGGNILARGDIKPLRKDVLAKCYGGDITRKMKLLRRQAEGKKKQMKMYGNIEVPRETFINLLKR
ncbi:translation factor Guf1, mitochondrial-like isoform X2 [Portunus trituberculatus]|uniref:translation factor Guf1, mitochondrial-like isoform X2 n=1 Tax=Portunus trituberculatus TaxID=210409 RepID=UPI001E1CEF96|nr:translation factor Guf1, mitochondrial-like isoform X2 [Portunus trituberculatus]XP_045102603.1 translation factor Guf1, mitochondrial-like isoform X2 [Portunus trituberculatus]